MFFPRFFVMLVVALVLSSSAAGAQDLFAPNDAPVPVAKPQQAPDLPLPRSLTTLPPISREDEIQLLRKQRPSLGGPIAVTAVGGGILVSSLALVGLAYAFDGLVDATHEGESRPLYARELSVPLIGAAVGAVLAGAGVVWLVHQLEQRRPYNRRLRELSTARAPGVLVSW